MPMVTKVPGASTVLGLLVKAIPTLRDELRKAKGKPSKAESECLIAYVRRLEERRVLYHPYNVEVVESCVASLNEVRRFTDETLAKIESPAARAALGAILDRSRAFVDRWHGSHTPRDWWDHGDHHRNLISSGHRRDGLDEFFQDLGELRGTMKEMLDLLMLVEPKIKAPNLLPEASA
jgi:hypothetical protein